MRTGENRRRDRRRRRDEDDDDGDVRQWGGAETQEAESAAADGGLTAL